MDQLGEKKFQVACVQCATNYDNVYQSFCPKCGGITDVEYDLNKAKLLNTTNPYERFKDLLPVQNKNLLPQNAVYTPVVHAKKLGEKIGLSQLYLKNETVLPTGTTKDRMAAIALSYLKECGVKTFCTSSTGNSSSAYAWALSKFTDLKLFIFTAADFYERVQYTDHPNIVHYVLRDASFVEAFNYSGKFAQLNGLVSERGFFNTGRREGLKLSFLEAADQIPGPIHWYVQAVSSAMGVYGVYKGAKELFKMGHTTTVPHLLCVQQETCSPMVSAWEDNSESIQPEYIVKRPSGIAEAILRGDPTRAYPFIREIVKESSGHMLSVSEKEIRNACRLVENLEGISICFSASTAVAGLIKSVKQNRVPAKDTVLINLTGRNRTSDEKSTSSGNVRWLYRTAAGWLPEKPELEGELFQSGNFQ
jgi:threonine synthase